MVLAICQIQAPDEQLKPVVEELYDRLDSYPGQARGKSEHLQFVGLASPRFRVRVGREGASFSDQFSTTTAERPFGDAPADGARISRSAGARPPRTASRSPSPARLLDPRRSRRAAVIIEPAQGRTQ